MTELRRRLIALFVMGQIIQSLFSKDKSAIDRKAASDAGFLTGPAKPQTTELRTLMHFLVEYPTWQMVEIRSNHGDLAYRWLMFHFAGQSIQFDLFRRQVGNQSHDLRISNIQLVEFYRQLMIDIVNQTLGRLEDEAPLRD